MAQASRLDEAQKHDKNGLRTADTTLRCQIITDFAMLQDLAPAWQRLWQADAQAEIFQSFAWAQAWWQSFGPSVKLYTPVVFKGHEVVLILPLVQSGCFLRFLGSPHADYSDMLCSPQCAEESFPIALQALLSSAPGWRECLFQNLRPDSKILRATYGLPRELKQLIQLEVTNRCPTIVLGENKSEVINERLAIKHIQRRLKRLGKAGVIKFRHIEDRLEAQQQLTNFFRCHRRRSAVLAKTSCFDAPEMQSLIRNLADQLDLRQELRLGALELNGQPIAWSLGFQVHGKYAYYQQTFDVDAEAYEPGDVLLHFLLLYAKQSVEREFDLLRGDQIFKMRIATNITPTRTAYLERPGLRGQFQRYRHWAQGRLHAASSQLGAVARRSETMFRVARSMRVWTSTLTRRLRCGRANREMLEYLFVRCSHWIRNFMWSTTNVLIFRRATDKDTGLQVQRSSDSTISIMAARFSDLADLVLEHPAIHFPGFGEFKNRFNRGEQAYLARRNGKLVLVAWARPVTDLSRVRKVSPMSESKAAIEMYECWPIDNVVSSCAKLMSVLAAQARKADADLLICCPNLPGTCRAELTSEGFFPDIRVVDRRVCGLLQPDDVDQQHSQVSHGSSLVVPSCPKFDKQNRV